jgi:hypothetical protein
MHFVGMRNRKATLLVAIGIPVAVIGWAAFRPELLFVNKSVNETGPAAAETLRTGSFESYAHETKGKATILKSAGSLVLRLSEFSTSNGPDVHILLSKTNDPQNIAGSIDLGSIKGNQGDQNYTLPAGTDPDQYNSVTVWCKRFDVSFGGASLSKSVSARFAPASGFQLATFSSEIMVTGGGYRGLGGRADIIEKSGQRFLKVSGVKPAPGRNLWLVKAEDARTTADVRGATKIDLGLVKTGVNYYSISKDIDVWLYRTAVIWDSKRKSSVATAPLRSAQEMAPKSGEVTSSLLYL